MGFLDEAKKKLGDAVDKHGDKISDGLDKAGAKIDERTGGKYSDKITTGVSADQGRAREPRRQARRPLRHVGRQPAPGALGRPARWSEHGPDRAVRPLGPR